MIAEAIRDALPNATRISVDLQTIRWSDPVVGLRYTYLTPVPAQKALIRFDYGEQVQPFWFQLRGGHAASMVSGGHGASPQRQKHNLGRRKIIEVEEQRENSGIVVEEEEMKVKTTRKNWTETVESIGGKPPPRLDPKHASHHTARIFGLKAFTSEFGDIKKPLPKK